MPQNAAAGPLAQDLCWSAVRAQVLLISLVGCAGTFGARDNGRGALGHVNRIGWGLASLSIACDWTQTRYHAANGWRDELGPLAESNPIIGGTPSTTTVDVYMATAIAATVIAGSLLPSQLRPVLFGSIVVRQSIAIAHNIGEGTPGICGLQGAPVRDPSVARTR